ncbi:ESX secretion-associated protein EspG [Nocardia salmonicida]|uniref:ESX secretion-associated protein EspG n=1 Tax=Nocardia salmonicida TaxID=53431 RepID=UPI0033EBCB27
MEKTWHLTGLEYRVLRQRLLDRNTNWPFIFRSEVRRAYEYEFVKARVWGELRANWDPALAEVLAKALTADVRIAVLGRDKRDPADFSGNVTVTAKRFGDRALVMQGFHTTTRDSHDQLVLTECDASALTALLVAELPDVAAGSRGRVVLPSHDSAAEFDHWHGRSTLYDVGDGDHEVRGRDWQRAPKATVGRILITHGHSAFGPRGQVRKAVFWEDHVDDGRYLIDIGPPVAAIGTDAAGLAKAIDRQIGEVLLVRGDEARTGFVRGSVYDDGE